MGFSFSALPYNIRIKHDIALVSYAIFCTLLPILRLIRHFVNAAHIAAYAQFRFEARKQTDRQRDQIGPFFTQSVKNWSHRQSVAAAFVANGGRAI